MGAAHFWDSPWGYMSAGWFGVNRTASEVDGDAALNGQIDAAYRAKYGYPSSAVSHITSPAARAATIKLVPRQTGF